MKEPAGNDGLRIGIVKPCAEFMEQLRQRMGDKKPDIEVHWPKWSERGFWRVELRSAREGFCAVLLTISPNCKATVRCYDDAGEGLYHAELIGNKAESFRTAPEESIELLGAYSAFDAVGRTWGARISEHLIGVIPK